MRSHLPAIAALWATIAWTALPASAAAAAATEASEQPGTQAGKPAASAANSAATPGKPASDKPASAKSAQGTGKRLEDDPYALEKLRKLLEGGVPELMTVKVKVPANAPEVAASTGSSTPSARSKPRRTGTEPPVPASLGLAPDSRRASTGAHAQHWSYEGDFGPHAWGQLKADFSTCSQGKVQSPIHIQPGDAVGADLEPISFDYGPLLGKIEHNGHTVQVTVSGNHMLSVRGRVYKLVQFHFHHPAEEMINYKGFPMVAHLVHKDAEGQLAVVAVLLEMGDDNPLIGQLWARMPMKAGEQFSIDAARTPIDSFLPKDRAYYAFQGSLTTPPCSEGVSWFVLKNPISLSQAQLQTFRRLFPLNARPTQPINGRLVQESR